MTVHEHWLVCPMHVLWKHDREICEQPKCFTCTLKARRPPQIWRNRGVMARGLAALDALVCPSLSTRDEHAKRGVKAPFVHIPYFLPHDYTGLPQAPVPKTARPYFAAVGRLEKIKGFQDAIAAFAEVGGVDLRIAGAGSYETELRRQAQGLSNVYFEGRLDSANVAALVRGARALIVPSLVHETFGYVVLEAFHERTPVIVRDLGALPELVEQSGGGLVFDSPAGLVEAIQSLVDDNDLRDELGENGFFARQTIWSESRHMDLYLGLIESLRDPDHAKTESLGALVSGPKARPKNQRGLDAVSRAK